MNLKRYGEWALVTGCSSGLGRAFAERLASEGLNCVLVGLEGERLERLSIELAKQYNIECRFRETDLTSDEFLNEIKAATNDIEIDILVNNAGIGCGGNFWSVDADQVSSLVRLNCLAPTVLTRELLPGMIERNRGAVVIVASVMGFISAPGETAYNASKAFDLHFGESLWGELRNTPVDVITVCPAAIRTDFFQRAGFSRSDQQRIHYLSDKPDDIAYATLRNLGHKPVYSPPASWAIAILTRLISRRMTTLLTQFVLTRFTTFYK